jgi:hypothetical protein
MIKTTDLDVRSITHRSADRVRAHILRCLLAYDIEWHLRKAWRELMYLGKSLRRVRGARHRYQER